MNLLLNIWRFFLESFGLNFNEDSSEEQGNDDNNDDEVKTKFFMPCLGKDVTVQEKMEWMWQQQKQQQEHDDVFSKLLCEIKENTAKINEMKSLLKYDLTHMTELIYLKNRNVEILLELFDYRDYKFDMYKHDRNLKTIRSKFLENEKYINAISKQFQAQQSGEMLLNSCSTDDKVINEPVIDETENFQECLNKFCSEMNDNIESIVQKCVENKVAEFSVCDDVCDKISENRKVLMKLNRFRRFLRKLRKRQEIRQHYRNMYLRKTKKRDLSSNILLNKPKSVHFEIVNNNNNKLINDLNINDRKVSSPLLSVISQSTIEHDEQNLIQNQNENQTQKEDQEQDLSDTTDLKSIEDLSADEFNNKTVENDVQLMKAIYQKLVNFNGNRTPTPERPKIYKEFIGDINLKINRKSENPSLENILNIEQAEFNFVEARNNLEISQKKGILKSNNFTLECFPNNINNNFSVRNKRKKNLKQDSNTLITKKLDLSKPSTIKRLEMLSKPKYCQFSEQTSVIESVNLDYVVEDAVISSGYFDNANMTNNKNYPELTTQENELLAVCSEPFFNLNQDKINNTVSDEDSQQVEVERKSGNFRIESSDDEKHSIDLDCDQSRFSENEAKVVDYDSEENEIIVDKLEQNEFFEKEAELSGSEWDSADEDEKNLDIMEPELGDQDVFNEKKLQRELERIHMRQVLDTDKKEVRLIQELVFEDGDLFSENGGRQRQYRWKNIDLSTFGNDNDDKENDADADELIDDDEDTEEHWRKFRHEKSIFLEKYKNNINVEESNTFDATEIFNCDSKEKLIVEKHSRDTEVFIKPTIEDKFEPFTENSNKRGSFLSRNDKVLEKLAVISRSVCASSIRQRKRIVFLSCDSNSSSRSLSMYPNSDKVKKRKLNSVSDNDDSNKSKILKQ